MNVKLFLSDIKYFYKMLKTGQFLAYLRVYLENEEYKDYFVKRRK